MTIDRLSIQELFNLVVFSFDDVLKHKSEDDK